MSCLQELEGAGSRNTQVWVLLNPHPHVWFGISGPGAVCLAREGFFSLNRTQESWLLSSLFSSLDPAPLPEWGLEFRSPGCQPATPCSNH